MPYVSIPVFALIYIAAAAAWGIPYLVGAAYAIASVICFIAYAQDKSAARAGRRRTRENTLLLLGAACGWPGAVLAQQWLRHKSGKRSFLVRFWATVVLNVAAFLYLGERAAL
ncbi:MAG: DUF1294 domain-containing protein [Telluria sp.]|nr:DUF1294 domain-containing protein [Telluria sp.]